MSEIVVFKPANQTEGKCLIQSDDNNHNDEEEGIEIEEEELIEFSLS